MKKRRAIGNFIGDGSAAYRRGSSFMRSLKSIGTQGEYFRLQGDGRAAEEYIPGPGGGTSGSTYVDLTARATNGTTVRVQTIDTLSDGITPTKAEAAAAARIGAAYPEDELRLIPKWPK